MSRYNTYFANDFAACMLLAYAHDPYRGREVRLYKIPGETDTVGVTDGTDKWVAPTIGDPFGINIRQLMVDRAAGKPVYRPDPPGGGRRRLLVDPSQPQVGQSSRRKLIQEEAPKERRRVTLQA
jgi:hypothetical protein